MVKEKLTTVEAAANSYDQQATRGNFNIVYNFGEGLIDDQAMALSGDGIEIPGVDKKITFQTENRYADMI